MLGKNQSRPKYVRNGLKSISQKWLLWPNKPLGTSQMKQRPLILIIPSEVWPGQKRMKKEKKKKWWYDYSWER